jgi:uncharacterized Tic20 family protein
MTSTPSDPTPEGAVPPPAPEGAVPPPPGAVPPPAYNAPPPGYGQPYAAAQPPLSDSDQRMWAMLAHLGGILFSFVAPLIVWLVFKDRGRFVDEQAKEALNFQITLIIGYVISTILIVVLIGAFLMFIVWLAAIIFGILAAVAANKGEAYRYPFAIRLIK